MSWHFLQGQEAAFWVGTSLDGAPSALLNLIPTPAVSSLPVNATDICRGSRSRMTCEPSTATHGADTLTSSAEDSHAKTFHPQAEVPESRASGPVCGEKWRELSVRFDRVTSGWKTHQCLWVEDLPWSSVTLPRWGMMRDGVLLERTTQEPVTSGTESGFWPTPCASDNKDRGNLSDPAIQRRMELGKQINLSMEVKKWPGGGTLNPNWVEWLMGWPLGWTSMEPMPQSTWVAWQRAFQIEQID